jgi:hypothetical protein
VATLAALCACISLAPFAMRLEALAQSPDQENPAAQSGEMEHMQQGSHDGGFMQEGMHHVTAKGVTL